MKDVVLLQPPECLLMSSSGVHLCTLRTVFGVCTESKSESYMALQRCWELADVGDDEDKGYMCAQVHVMTKHDPTYKRSIILSLCTTHACCLQTSWVSLPTCKAQKPSH